MYLTIMTFVMTLVALSAHIIFYLINIFKNRKHVFIILSILCCFFF